MDTDLDVDKAMFDLNVFSIVNLNRIVLRYFLENKRGQVAVTSSIAGKIGAPFSGSYTGSKFALHVSFIMCSMHNPPILGRKLFYSGHNFIYRDTSKA